MMSAITKKMHVHFPDEVTNSAMDETCADDVGLNDRAGNMNYSRQELLLLRDCSSAMMPPILFDEMTDEGNAKIRDKINYLLRPAIPQSSGRKSGHDMDENLNALNFMSGMGQRKVGDTHKATKDRVSSDPFMASAHSSGQLENPDALLWRRPIDGDASTARGVNSSFWDTRCLGNDARGLGTDPHRNQFGREFSWNKNRNYGRQNARNYGNDYRYKEAEPEWMSAGPISQDDVMELGGFQDNIGDMDVGDKYKSSSKENMAAGSGRGTPPVNSTPTKMDASSLGRHLHNGNGQKHVTNENFNFEDFLKLDLNGHGSRETGKCESRFTRWFRKDSPSKHSKTASDMTDTAFTSADQFFELMQKSKKVPSNLVGMSSQFRSVEDLEADICVPNGGFHANNATAASDMAAMRMMNQFNMAQNAQKQVTLQDIMNKNAYDLFQMQLAQEQILRRPDAQQILQRLTRNEISLWHVLQLLGNPNITPYDRDSLMAVINFCNGNNRLQDAIKQQSEAQLQQRCRQYMRGISAHNVFQRPPTPQELQVHTQAIMQKAMLKKQLEQFCMLQQQSLAADTGFLQQGGMRNFNGASNNDMHRMQQFNQQSFFKRSHGRKPTGLPMQQQQAPGQMAKQGFGRRTPQNASVAFQLSPVVQRKWSSQSPSNAAAAEAVATATASPTAGPSSVAAATATDLKPSAATAGSSSVGQSDAAGSGFDQVNESLQTSHEVEK